VDFTALYQEQSRVVAGYFLRRTSDPEAAADLTAETFAAALASVRRYDPGRGEPAEWLFGIAGHQLARYHRRGTVDDRARRRMRMERLELSDAAAERLEAEAVLDHLPAEDRDLVRARVVDERPYAELAAAAGVSEPAIRQRVSRALSRLRKELS
jgi:RNA polymerase sigma-70 factor (ECF subfamily)